MLIDCLMLAFNFRPLIKVPLVLPKSVIKIFAPSCSICKCFFEIIGLSIPIVFSSLTLPTKTLKWGESIIFLTLSLYLKVIIITN